MSRDHQRSSPDAPKTTVSGSLDELEFYYREMTSEGSGAKRGLSMPVAVVVAAAVLAAAAVVVVLLLRGGSDSAEPVESAAYDMGVRSGAEARTIDDEPDGNGMSYTLTCSAAGTAVLSDEDRKIPTQKEREDFIRGCNDGYNGATDPK